MLAVRLTDVFFPWQMPLLLGLVAIWLWVGGTLLWLGARHIVKYRWANYAQSQGTNLVAAVAGLFAYVSIIFVGSVWDRTGAIVGLVAGAVVAVATMWYVIAYRFDIPYTKAIFASSPKLAEIVVIGPLLLAVLLPTQRALVVKREEEACASNLRAIFREITPSVGKSPDPNLILLADPARMRCPSATTHSRMDYFYLPLDLEESDDQMRMMVCDFRSNHQGRGRNVYFGSGEVRWLTEDEFQNELQKPRNSAFAEALAKEDR